MHEVKLGEARDSTSFSSKHEPPRSSGFSGRIAQLVERPVRIMCIIHNPLLFFSFFLLPFMVRVSSNTSPPRSPYVAQRSAALTQKYLKSFPRRKEERRTTKDEGRRKTDSTSAPRTSHLEGVGVRCFPVYCTPPIKTLNGTAATLKPKCGRRRRQTPPRISI